MKNLIWKPSTVSWQVHLVIAIASLICLVIVESFKINVKQPYYREKNRAAKYMLQGMEILKQHRVTKIGAIDKSIDPLRSGMIGVLSSPITSTTIDIDSKLITINPNWAAVIVSMLKEARVKNNSTLAVSLTGSFPAMNLAVFSAAKAMNLRLVIITSVASSTWGANIPNFTWLDMEEVLHKYNFCTYKTIAASLGGVQDRGLGMSEQGKRILRENILKHRIALFEFDDMKKNIDTRIDTYLDQAKDTQIAAYINVGGGTVAVGSFIGKMRYKPGLNIKPSNKALRIDSVMSRFGKDKVPILNINSIKTLAKNYNLPGSFKKIPKIGSGEIYNRLEYNKVLVVIILVFLIVFLYLFMKLGIGDRIFIMKKKSVTAKPPEHMV
jgi:poly-gamma-glutamate system protein